MKTASPAIPDEERLMPYLLQPRVNLNDFIMLLP
jgi:hypothetical protein